MIAFRLFTHLLLLLPLFTNTVIAQTDFLGSTTPPDHPRLLLLQNEEDKIKNIFKSDKTWSAINQAILTEADNMIVLPTLERKKIGRRLLDKSREALRRIFYLSYSYRITNQKKYADRAEKEMLAIAAFSDWNPTHFLDVGEMTMAISIGYDWLFTVLSPTSKKTIREAIISKGLQPSLDSNANSWLKAEHNWNQVCNAGITFGALATFEDNPGLSKQLINRALNTIGNAMKDYGPDGIYPEGYGYWAYGTSFNVMFISAIEKAFGTDYGLTKHEGFLNTARFLENMTGPSNKPFNYSDSGPNGELQPAMFWFANKLKDPSILWVEKQRLLTEDSKLHVQNRLLPALMLWNGNWSLNKIKPPEYDLWAGNGKNPIAMMRTSWTDTNAIYLAAKGGSVSINHAHMDVGSFIMEANGVRWAMDFGLQAYETLESKGMSIFGRTQDAQRWTVFRYSNLAHNTLTFNNQQQRVSGHAPLIGTSKSASFLSATFNISAVYKGSVASAKRGVSIVNRKYVLIRDELETLGETTTTRWSMLTPATVNITGKNTAELTMNGKKMILTVREPAVVTMKTWSTVPPNDFDAANPGTTLVGFEVYLPSLTSTALSVTLTPVADRYLKFEKIKPLHGWK